MQGTNKISCGKVDTNLEGRASLPRLPAGSYWVSTLDLDAGAGDSRLKWDLPITIEAGKTTPHRTDKFERGRSLQSARSRTLEDGGPVQARSAVAVSAR